MWLNLATSLLLPALATATMITAAPEQSSTLTTSATIPTQIENVTPSITTIPISFTPTPTPASNMFDSIISGAHHMMDEISEHLHIDLRKRQGAPVVATAAAGTVPVQMPAVTVYDMYDGVARTYTQLFVAVPDQWPSPSAGTIGLGSIPGTVGVIKSVTKREVDTLPTSSAAQTLRIRGREVVIP